MKTKAAILRETGADWEVTELDLDEPKANEVLIRFEVSGMCHSDEHLRTGDLAPEHWPVVGGHEGAGVIEQVGPGVSRVKEGDHVVCAFIPACGHCRWCATGHQNLCDLGAMLMQGCLPDGTFRFHENGTDLAAMCMLGTFSQWAVISEASCVRIDDDIPFEVAALTGCGVPTGWGSAVYSADVRPGENVIVYGIGGVGANSVQGAAHAGAKNLIAVDPLANKREMAEQMGATHSVASAEEALELVTELSGGLGADKTIVTVDVATAEVIGASFEATRKGGTVVVSGLGNMQELYVQLPGAMLTLYEKTLKGSLFGGSNPVFDIVNLLDLYRAGKLKLDELITNRYTLDQIGDGYRDLLDGKNVRGIIVHEH